MATATLTPPLRQTANPAPVRPAGSIRRTSSIDVSWPNGPGADRLMIGRVRDYATPADGAPGRTLAEAEMRATLSQDKTITSITADPAPLRLPELVGQRGGGHLRMVIGEIMPDLLAEAAPLYLALDDISGTALVSAFAWSQWYPDWVERMHASMQPGELEKMVAGRVHVCWGLQEGNSGVSGKLTGNASHVASADAGELRNPADLAGWHEFPASEGAGFRRARRIDVSLDEAAGLIRIDSSFQDSAVRKEGGRLAIHEYNLAATVDATTLELLTITPEAHVLPFSECPGAIHNTQRLVGSSLSDIRASVLAMLRGPQGCTHLNDALRALAEVPSLAASLRG